MVARGTILNLLGQAAPLLLALAAIPWTIAEMGTARFGVLALVWGLLGYFNLLDLGLGRAVTHSVAESDGVIEGVAASRIRTVLLLIFLVGLALTPGLWLVSPLLVRLLGAPDAMKAELLTTVRLLSMAVPFVVSANGMRGLLEAKQRFGLINAIRIPNAALNYLAPLVVFHFVPSLGAVTAALLAGRVLSWLAHMMAVARVAPGLVRPPWRLPPRKSLLPTVRFASWIAVSNVVGPIMAGLDRFLLASLVSIDAVTYYATPYEAITRLWILPGALVPVLFPIFSGLGAREDSRLLSLLQRSLRGMALLLFPVVAAIIALASPLLHLWLGPELATATHGVLVWLAIGVFLNSMAQIPYSLVQGFGRPDITAKFHLLELPVFLAVFAVLAPRFGAIGAAQAWTFRVGLDAVLVAFAASRMLATRYGSAEVRLFVATMVVPVLAMAGIASTGNPLWRYTLLFVSVPAYDGAIWRFALSQDDRSAIRRLVSGILLKGNST